MNSTSRLSIFGTAIAILFGMVACDSGGPDPWVFEDKLVVTPGGRTIVTGQSVQFEAGFIQNAGETVPVTDSATWTSSNPAVVTISGGGKATAVAMGSTTITATYRGKSGQASLVVGPDYIRAELSPTFPEYRPGPAYDITLTGILEDVTKENVSGMATFSSSNTAIASFAGNMVTGHAPGKVAITGEFNGWSETTILTIIDTTLDRIELTADDATIRRYVYGPTGAKELWKIAETELTVTAFFNDGFEYDITDQVTWSIPPADENLGALEDSTYVAADFVKDGDDIKITASALGTSDTITLTVDEVTPTSIAVTADPTTVEQVLVGAAGSEEVWQAGTTELEVVATFSDSSTADATDVVTYTIATADAGLGSMSDNEFTADSSAQDGDTVEIKAQFGEATVTDTITITIDSTTRTKAQLASITITGDDSVAEGDELELTANGDFGGGVVVDMTDKVTWEIQEADEDTASVSDGVVTGIKRRATDVTVTASYEVSSTVTREDTFDVTVKGVESIAITGLATVAVGGETQLVVTATYSDGSTDNEFASEVLWTSSDRFTATVSNASDSEGLVTGVMAGPITMTAEYNAGSYAKVDAATFDMTVN